MVGQPRTADCCSGNICRRSRLRTLRLAGMTSAACTRILIWPGPGPGMATRDQASMSGSPYLVSIAAYGIAFLPVTADSAR